MTDEDSDYYHYQASLPGFSYFAIAAEKKEVVEEVAEIPEEPSFTTQAVEETPAAEEITSAEEAVKESIKEFKLWYLLLLIPAVLVVVFLVYFTKRKKPGFFKRKKSQKKGEIVQHLIKEHQAEVLDEDQLVEKAKK